MAEGRLQRAGAPLGRAPGGVPHAGVGLRNARAAPPVTGRVERSDERGQEEAGGGTALACARCLNEVTTTRARIEVAGSHAHTFTNPHGLRFRIGCFASAAGCVATSPPSSYWSWFPGCTWQVGQCAACAAHLGWLFVSADARFHGLILERLVERQGS